MKITRKRLLFAVCLLAVIASMPTYLSINKVYADNTGFVAPSANATGSTGTACNNPGNAYGHDILVVSCKKSPLWSEYYSGFIFPSIPSGATIDGIEVLVDAYHDCNSPTCNSWTWTFDVRLYSDSGWSATWLTTPGFPYGTPGVDTQYTIGDPGNLAVWGGTWTVSSFSGANFKLEIHPSGTSTSSGAQWELDYIAVKVYYHMAVIEAGDYVTFTQGAYGGPGAPYDALSCNFATVFPSGLVAGTDYPGPYVPTAYSIKFTTASAVQDFLPQGGTAGVLTANAVDPTDTAAGVLAGQVVTNNINLALSTAGASFCGPTFGDNTNFPTGLGSLKISSTYDFNGLSSTSPLRGMTVSAFVTLANQVLGGGALPPGVTVDDINKVATAINECFDGGLVYTGALVL